MSRYFISRPREKAKISLPVKCLAIYFALMPFDSFPVFGMGSLLKVIALLPLGAIIILKKQTSIRINKLTAAFIIYIIFNALTFIYSVNLSASWFSLKRLLLNGVLIIAVGGMNETYSKEEFQYLLKALILGGLATVILTLLFADTATEGRLTLSINGTKQDQNYINGYMFFAFSFFVEKLVAKKKWLYAIPSLLLIVFTLLTGSRGALLALVMLGVMILLFNLANTGKLKPEVILIACALFALILLSSDYILSLLPQEVAERFSGEYIANYKGLNRNALWKRLLVIFYDGNLFRRLFGYGYGTVAAVNSFNHMVAHNMWLEHLISGGYIGVVILTYMFAVFGIEAWKNKNAIVFASYMGYLMMCVTLSITNYKPLWNSMMMIMISYNVRTDENLSERGE